MTTPTSTWQAIAALLAERMSYHAYCDLHSARAAQPDTCPNCADRGAYQAWQAKSGKTHRSAATGPAIDIFRDAHLLTPTTDPET